MTLVQNHLRPLSGNRFLGILLCISLIWGACSPQVIQRTTVKPNTEVQSKETVKKNPTENPNHVTVKSVHKKADEPIKMAILLPFKSHSTQIATASKVQLQSLDVAIDFYQGFMLGLKEQLHKNIPLEIEVLDTEDDASVLKKFQSNGDLKKDILVGPLYPASIKQISAYVKENQILTISPLSAASPAVFQNKELVSMMPNIAVHADKLVYDAHQEVKNLTQTNFLLVNPADEESETFAKEIRAYFQKYFPNSALNEIQSPQQIAALKPNENEYCVFVASASRAKTVPLLNALGKFKDLNSGTAIKVYGHPNWGKQGYSAAILNKLNIHYTAASYHLHLAGKSSAFESKYKSEFTLSPSDYAYMGYDMGVFLAKCFNETHQIQLSQTLTQVKYNGLSSNFDLAYHPQFGYVNLGLRLISFSNNQAIVK